MAQGPTPAQRAIAANAARGMTPQQRAAYGASVIASQILEKQKKYYSAVRFQFTVAAGVATLNPGQVNAFSYGVGDVPTLAGFDASFGKSTEAETNMVTKGNTMGAQVQIYGMGFYLGETSDAWLTKLIFANTSADITLNGVDRYALIGKPGIVPGGGGLSGLGQTWAIDPNQNSDIALVGTTTNGVAHTEDFYRLPSPLTWYPLGATEANFQIRFTVQRALSWTYPAARVASAGITAYTPPANATPGALGSYVDLTVYLWTTESQPRSQQA